MKYYLVAGEPSGDLHGSNLINHLKKLDKHADFRGLGGDLMEKAGAKLSVHYKKMSFIGIIEVLKNLKKINRTLEYCRQDINNYKPDALILIDYPGFNLRFAGRVRPLQVPVVYYISPQLWAWGRGRVNKIRRLVDRMLVVFPFEVDFYQRFGIMARYVGHPLVDTHYRAVKPKDKVIPGDAVLGLMPGSRQQELDQLLPGMLQAVDILRRGNQIDRVVIAAVDHLDDTVYRKFIGDRQGIEIYRGPLAEFYNSLDAAVVKSGTATLETAYFQVPLVIVYRVNRLTWFLGKRMVKLDFIGLANIVAGEKIATELLQDDFTAERAASEVSRLLAPDTNRTMRQKLRIIQDRLGEPGASERAAEEIERFVKEHENEHA